MYFFGIYNRWNPLHARSRLYTGWAKYFWQSTGMLLLKAHWKHFGTHRAFFSSSYWPTGQEWMHTATAQHWSTWRKQFGRNVLSYLELKWHFSMMVATPLHPMSQCNSWSSCSLASRLIIFTSLDQWRKISNERNFNMRMVWKMRCTDGCRHWVQSTHSHSTYIKLILTLSSL